MTHRVVVLCGPSLSHRHTCATVIERGLNVVGVCEADQRTKGVPLAYLRKSVKQKGLAATLSRAAARALYHALNFRKDREVFRRLFDSERIRQVIQEWQERGGDIHRTQDYSSPKTIEWLREKRADILVVHTPYWVGKAVRGIPRTGIVLGGHPGITPNYRGSHSAFWAIYAGKPEDVGCTVFLINEGVDSGDIVAQEHLAIEKGDSFVTLAWKGMVRTAHLQAAVLQDLDRGVDLRRRQPIIPADSVFDNPRLGEYLRYLFMQRRVR